MTSYQYTFSGNLIVSSKKWALAIHDSHWGDISQNVIYRAEGAGIVTEDGSEVGNQIKQNLVARISGRTEYTNFDASTGNVIPYEDGQGGQAFSGSKRFNDVARGGTAFWFARTGNFVEGNVASDAIYAAYDFSGYYDGLIRYPVGPGLDKTVSETPNKYADNVLGIAA